MRGGDDFAQLAAAVRDAADKDLGRAVSKSLRAAAKPIGQSVIRAGAAKMPKHGGLAARVAQYGRVGVRSNLRQHGNNPHVELTLTNKGVAMRRLDAGILRHPVFGNRHTWATQRVPAGEFTRAFEEASGRAEEATLAAMQQVLGDVARKVN